MSDGDRGDAARILRAGDGDAIKVEEPTLPSARALMRQLRHQVQVLDEKSRELGEIRAMLFVNFVRRETYGVQVEDRDWSTHGLLMKVIEELAARIPETER
jgi:hypothetical protein